MSNLLLNASTKDYSELIGNGATYRVPPYQRDYSWSEDHWSDLWADILGLEEEKDHYLGYLVLQKNVKDKDFWIIDGQQRLATLAILALAVENLLKEWSDDETLGQTEKENNRKRADAIHSRFLGNYSAARLSTTSKLFLNKNNNDFYHAHLLSFNPPSKAAKLKPSQRLLFKAYDFFLKKLKEHFNHPNGTKLAAFLEEEIAPHLVFTTIEVSDEFSAYKVFETLNARGVKLSPSDLLKNYLFSIAVKNDTTDFEEAERLWQLLGDKIGEGDLPTFIRYFWNSRNAFVRSAELYRSIKSFVDTKEKVFTFLRELNKVADLYVALGNPNNDIWLKEQRYPIKILKMFRVTACYPLLMISQQNLRPKEFTKILEEMVVLTFRRTVIGNLSTNELEPVFNRCSLGVFRKEMTTAKKIHDTMKMLYVKDEDFQSAFSRKEVSYSNKKDVIRYIFAEMENHLRKNHELQYDGEFTLEHIMPQTHSVVWDANFTPNEREDCLNRLANFSPLENEINNKLKNDWPFSKKVPHYKKSSYLLTQYLSKLSDWTPAAIDRRQEDMAKKAVTIWKSAFEKTSTPRKKTPTKKAAKGMPVKKKRP